uniref:Uncharacterized protein n=1 Tax=viral metagenome TaxID=1070528 RepID=A0A6C0KVI2_9ZZZZ
MALLDRVFNNHKMIAFIWCILIQYFEYLLNLKHMNKYNVSIFI